MTVTSVSVQPPVVVVVSVREVSTVSTFRSAVLAVFVTTPAAASFTVKFRETDRSTDCLPLSTPTKVWEEKTGSPSPS